MADYTAKSRPLINGRFPHPPFWLRAALLIAVCLSLLLVFLLVRKRYDFTAYPRVHFVQDMDNQVKYKAQDPSEVFADGRSDRPEILGTVARGRLMDDDHLWRGYTAAWNAGKKGWDVTFLNGYPVPVDDALLKRGQHRFNTFCMPCHGYDGGGAGPVHQRSDYLSQNPQNGMAWVPPSNLNDAVRMAREDGHIYNTITNGIRNMAPYGSQIQDPYDRWAIVAYVRALQLSAAGRQQTAGADGPAHGPTTQTAAR
ncbi:MAG TPA: cytochrome c [Tepidisphaeraceae bacterium]|jgi:mono/diheme cytochrome c family protein